MTDRPGDAMDDLLAAYALDAVDGDERRRVEAYLATSAPARAEVDRHRAVAALLPVGTERPPDGLWDRIAGALEEPAPAPGPRLAQVLPAAPARRRRGFVGAAAAALVAAAAAVVVTVAVVRDDGPAGDTPLAAAYEEALAAPEGRRAELVGDGQPFRADAVVLPDGTGFLAADELPALPDTETWQLWGVYGDDDVISLGVLGNRPGIEPFTAEDDVQTLVITREQAGGVMASTTGAVLAGELN